MTKTPTPRLGISTWSSDQDNHGGRTRVNEDHQTLDRLVAVWAGKGLLSARPAPSIEGRFYVATNVGDGGRLSIDLGNTWLDLSTLGGGGAPPAPNVDGPGSEGVSNRAMRADARIPLPLATANNHGALASQHFELLESATAGGTPWSVPIRDGSGRIRLGAGPAHDLDAVTRAYADNLGTPYPTAGAIVRRWSSGHISSPDPDKPEFLAPKRYVDARASRAEWKTDVAPIPYGLAEVNQWDLYSYTYNNDAPSPGDTGMGPMVGQVAEVTPALAMDGDDGAPERVRDRDALWVLARAIQELSAAREDDHAVILRQGQHLRRLESTVVDLVRIVNDLTAEDAE